MRVRLTNSRMDMCDMLGGWVLGAESPTYVYVCVLSSSEYGRMWGVHTTGTALQQGFTMKAPQLGGRGVAASGTMNTLGACSGSETDMAINPGMDTTLALLLVFGMIAT